MAAVTVPISAGGALSGVELVDSQEEEQMREVRLHIE